MTKHWHEQELIKGVKWFIDDFGRPPGCNDLLLVDYLPTSKTFERRYGGLLAFREKFGFGGDARKTKEYALSVTKSIERNFNYEKELSEFLINIFAKKDERNVVLEQRYSSVISRNRSDFGVYHKYGHFFVDVFFAKDKDVLIGCVNIKLKKIKKSKVLDIIYLVCSNPNMPKEYINNVSLIKKDSLPKNVKVVSWKEFKTICQTQYAPR